MNTSSQLTNKQKAGVTNMLKMKLVLLSIIVVMFFSGQAISAEANMVQNFTLKPGWNSIYVEVAPTNDRIETIFSGVPVKSVWRWIPDKLGNDFLQDPAEGLLSLDGWFGYFPEPSPEAFLTNLFTISANTAYLVYLGGSSNRTISISGKPEFKNIRWRSNGFTLTGLPVESSNEPTFADYFSLSAQHTNQPIYRLSNQGFWEVVNNPETTAIKSGEAYWVFTEGVSNYRGLIDMQLQQGEGLAFRTMFTEMDFMLSNTSDVTNFIRLERVGGVNMPMKFLNVDPETGEEAWPDLPNVRVIELLPGEDVNITLAVDRKNFTEEKMEQILSVSNEQGARYLLHASASTIQPLTLPTRNSIRGATSEAPVPSAGLWIGNVIITGVSEAQSGQVDLQPVGKPFVFRVMMHVSSTGTTKLLKNVVQMWQDGTYAPDPENPAYLKVETPGNYVLLTDPTLIPNYSGVTGRNGQTAGIRYSTVAYDFVGNELEMTGELALNGQLTVNMLIDSNMPTNPFYHKYHPDHDNLDAQFLNFKQEAFQITREMSFDFSLNNPYYPRVDDPPGWGDEEMGGTFRESISGLHKNTIFLQGDFKLQRVAATPVLNQ